MTEKDFKLDTETLSDLLVCLTQSNGLQNNLANQSL